MAIKKVSIVLLLVAFFVALRYFIQGIVTAGIKGQDVAAFTSTRPGGQCFGRYPKPQCPWPARTTRLLFLLRNVYNANRPAH